MCPSSTSGMKDSEMEEMEDGFEGRSALGFENDYEEHHFLTRLAKTLTKHDV